MLLQDMQAAWLLWTTETCNKGLPACGLAAHSAGGSADSGCSTRVHYLRLARADCTHPTDDRRLPGSEHTRHLFGASATDGAEPCSAEQSVRTQLISMLWSAAVLEAACQAWLHLERCEEGGHSLAAVLLSPLLRQIGPQLQEQGRAWSAAMSPAAIAVVCAHQGTTL